MTKDTSDSSEQVEVPPPSCFIVGPIGDRNATQDSPERRTYEEAIQIWEEVVLPACEAFGIRPVRADHIATTGEIPEQVFRRLRDDHLVIADLTGANPNVMYELGLRHTTGKLTIQMGEHARLPFDISSIRTIIFRRTEAGLIDARKRLAQAIGAGLQYGGDPVAATRVWFEQAMLSIPVTGNQEGLLPREEEELGFLEKLADMLEGMQSTTRIAETVAAVTLDIGKMVREATEQTNRINQVGGSPGSRIEIANHLARKLDDPATRLEVLVGEYSQSIERINPGVIYYLKLIRDDSQAQGAGDFTRQIGSLIAAVEGTIPQFETFRASLLRSGEATRDLRKVNRRIATTLERMLLANARMQEWKDLLRDADSPYQSAPLMNG